MLRQKALFLGRHKHVTLIFLDIKKLGFFGKNLPTCILSLNAWQLAVLYSADEVGRYSLEVGS